MEVDIDFLIAETERLLKRFEGSGEVELGVVLLCALEFFKKANAALSRISKSAAAAIRKRCTIRRYVYVRGSQGRWYRIRRKGDQIALRYKDKVFVYTLRPDGHLVGEDVYLTLSHLRWQARKPDAAYTDGGAW